VNLLTRWGAKLSFDTRARLETYEKLRAAAEDGISLKAAVDNLFDINNRPKRRTFLRHIYAAWSSELAAGQPFHEAVAGWVPSYEQMVLASSERGQSLVGALDALERQMIAGQRIKAAVGKALAFPAIYALMLLALLYVVSIRLVPELNRSLEAGQAEQSAPVFMAVVNTVNAAPWAPLLAVALLVGGVLFSLPFEFPLRKHVDALFPWSFYRLMQGSGFLLTLSGLLRIGANQAEAIENIAVRGSPWLRARVLPVLSALRAGRSFGIACDETGYRFPTQKIIDDVMFYESTSQATKAVARAADRWLQDAERETDKLAAAINVGGLVMVATFVLWVVYGVGTIVSGSKLLNLGGF